MLAGLGALAVGVLIGWHLRLSQRRTRASGATSTASSAAAGHQGKAIAPAGPTRFTKPVGAAGTCGCKPS